MMKKRSSMALLLITNPSPPSSRESPPSSLDHMYMYPIRIWLVKGANVHAC